MQTHSYYASTIVFQDQPGSWGQQTDLNQWSSAYYGYGQGYDAYAYGASHDPSLYAYGAYAGYGQYPQQAREMKLKLFFLNSFKLVLWNNSYFILHGFRTGKGQLS